MTASEKFIQLSAEAASRENQSTLLLLLCGGAALLASLMVSEETKAQYGQGLTWETHKIWWWRFLFIYFVPGVLLAELIVQVVTPTVLYEWLVVKSVRTGQELGMGDFAFVSVFLFCIPLVAYSLGRFWLRWRHLTPEPLPTNINMKRWVLDEKSGEYFEVTFRHGERYLMDTTQPHSVRFTKWLQTVEANKLARWGSFLSTVAAFISYHFAFGGTLNNNLALAGYAGLGIFGAAVIYNFFRWFGSTLELLPGRDFMVGPEPVVRGAEDANAEKPFGAGRWAHPKDIDVAAQGDTGSATDDLEFGD